jgi:hypothetical protein
MDDQAQTIADIKDYKLLMIATLALVPLLAVSKKSTAQSDDHARPDNDGKLEIAERRAPKAMKTLTATCWKPYLAHASTEGTALYNLARNIGSSIKWH